LDERLRDLERRARAGDADAAARLAAERERTRASLAPASTCRLDLLPHPVELHRRWIALSLLHVLLGEGELVHPEDDDDRVRDFYFQPDWSAGEQTGCFDDIQGERMFAVFSAAGVYFQGFAHERPMTPFRRDPPTPWPGLFDGLPPGLARNVDEPAFQARLETTFLVWWDATAPGWRTGVTRWHDDRDPDGSEELLAELTGSVEGVHRYLNACFDERASALRADALRAVLGHETLTPELARALRPDADPELVAAWARELRYGSPWPFAWS